MVKYGTMLMDVLHAGGDENHNCIFFCRAVRRNVRAAGRTMCEEGAAAAAGVGEVESGVCQKVRGKGRCLFRQSWGFSAFS